MKEVLEYLFERLRDKRPVTVAVAGQQYAVRANGELGAPVRELEPQWRAPTFQVSTLSGIVDLVHAKIDELPDDVALHVAAYDRVQLVALQSDEFGHRHVFAIATHQEGCAFKFDTYQPVEDFLINFRRSFLWNEEAAKIAKLCSNVESGMAVTLADDGISQQLEIKAGAVSKAQVEIPAEGILLTPWRTFRDATPVSSRFFLRFKGVKDGLPLVGLWEIDQMWKLETAQSIAAYLKKALARALVECRVIV